MKKRVSSIFLFIAMCSFIPSHDCTVSVTLSCGQFPKIINMGTGCYVDSSTVLGFNTDTIDFHNNKYDTISQWVSVGLNKLEFTDSAQCFIQNSMVSGNKFKFIQTATARAERNQIASANNFILPLLFDDNIFGNSNITQNVGSNTQVYKNVSGNGNDFNMMNMTGILVHKNIAANQNTFKPVMNGAFLVYCSFGGGCDIRYGDFGSGLNQCTIFNRVTIVQTDEMINCVVSDDKDIHQVAPHHDSQFIVGISDFSATLDMNDPGIYDPVSFQLTIPANYIYVGIITLTNGGGRTIQFINGLSSVLLQVQFRSSDFDSFSFSTTNRGAPPTSNSIVMNGYLVGGGGININGWDGFTPSDNITITNHFSSTINTIIGYPNIY